MNEIFPDGDGAFWIFFLTLGVIVLAYWLMAFLFKQKN